MNKIVLALIILGVGMGGFLTARQSTTQLHREANATREAWLAQTQAVATAQSNQASLIEHVRELKQSLAQQPPVTENALWSVLQTNRPGHFTPELREHLLEELGFNWRSSDEFIVVSKDTVREIYMQTIRGDKLSDNACIVLAITPGERRQVESALEGAKTEFKDWALSHTERSEPKGDVVAKYTLQADPTQSISNNLVTRICDAVGRERAGLIMPSARNGMAANGILNEEPKTMIVRRYVAGNEQRLKYQILNSFGTTNQSGDASPIEIWQRPFPKAFLAIFPDGWADVAKREGFELPTKPKKSSGSPGF